VKRASGILLSLLLLTGAAGCGDDDTGGDSAATTTEASADTETTAGGETDTTAGSSGDIENAEVADYCRQVDEFIEEYADVLADPTANPERAMEMLEPAGDLLDAATALDPSEMSPDDVTALNECAERLNDAQS
jgi:hypothetical protein